MYARCAYVYCLLICVCTVYLYLYVYAFACVGVCVIIQLLGTISPDLWSQDSWAQNLNATPGQPIRPQHCESPVEVMVTVTVWKFIKAVQTLL